MKINRNQTQKLFGFCFVLLIVALSTCTRQTDPPEFLKGPYLQNVKANAITIMWETAKPTIGKVVFGRSKSFGNEVEETDSTTIHEVTLTGLSPETVYYYQAISDGAKSAIHSFKTAVKRNSPFSFAVYGDSRNGPSNHEKIAKLILSKNPNFVIHTGDLVNRGYIYKQWGKLFFNPARKMLYSIPLFPALGNHERHADLYYAFFSLPNNEQWYSFDFGNAHFIILDSDTEYLRKGGEQLKWLVEDLKKNTATWTFVIFHHPPFTAGGNYYKKDRVFRKNLLHPIFEKYGVDLVLNGHDHNYERSFPIVSKSGKKPITYVVCGNGGTPMRYVGRREWTRYSKRAFGFVLIEIEGKKMHFQSISIDDEVIDEFSLDKDDPRSIAAYEENKLFFEDIKDPVEAIQYYHEGDDLLDDKKFQEALVAFKKAYRADTTCVEALAGIAECYYELEQFDKALEYAMKAIQKMPNYPDSYEVLIDVYVDQKKYDEALQWARRWLIIEPDKPDANEIMSKIYARQKKFDLAIEEIEKALAILPSDADLYFKLGKLYEAKGDRKKALAAYQKGLDWFMGKKEDKDVKKARKKVGMWTK